MMKCAYNDGKFIFEKGSGIDKGDYYIVINHTDDFSVYLPEFFNKAMEDILGGFKESGSDYMRRLSMCILSNANLVTIKNKKVIPLSSKICDFVCSKEFEVTKTDTHYRFIGEDKDKESIKETGVVEALNKSAMMAKKPEES